jgi:CHAT domain-containing protein
MFIACNSFSQQVTFDQFKNKYNLLFKEAKYDSSLVVAKQMNAWVLKNETDTSLRYPLSMKYVGNCFIKLNKTDSAFYYLKLSLKTLEKQERKVHSEYASSLNNLGVLYKEMGDYKAAEPLYKQALEIKKKELGDNHPSYAMSLDNLGVIYNNLGDYKAAEPLYKQALDIRKKELGDNHPDYAMSLNNLGVLYKQMGDYKAAEPLYKQALEIKKKVLGEDHQYYLSNLDLYAYLLLLTNREQEAQNILSKNFSKKAKEIADNFEWLNENQKDAYWKKESSFYDKLSWFANKAYEKVPEAVGLNYNTALVTKSKMLETKLSSDNFEKERDELKEQLIYRRRLLIKLESDGSDEIEKIKKLHKEADSLDKRLTMSWPEYAQQKKNLSITWEQVQQNLEKGEAAIEFVRFKNEDDSLYYYNALIIRKEDKYPQLVKLCKEKDLENIQPKLGFSTYYSLVWQPMEIVLKEVKTIYYAPIGLLNNVPFNAMYSQNHPSDEIVLTNESSRGSKTNKGQVKTPKNVVYLMDKYTLHQLTSTRYLAMGLKSKEKERFNTAMVMVGGVNYDFLPGSSNAFKKSKRNKDQSRSSSSAQQSLIYLEGTKFEIEQIDKKVKTSGWVSTVLESNQATEENIIKLEGKEAKGILHIATHGYAFPEYDFNDTLTNKNSLQYSYRYSTNPMVRSGLILAGGNWAWTGSDTLSKLGAEQNGILTALEVSQLNLKKTKLVVLSACETGLGKIEGSEGTFGLKRGFKLAGVEQIIVSLWSVPDKETMELMTLFYSDLAKTLNPVISFEKAQKEMRNKYPTDPEKWAGFVLVR